jgi:superfamily II DNA/RNA helicase
MEDTTEHLQQTPDGKVIIYSNMVEGGVRTISKALNSMGIAHGIFAGKGRFERDRDKDVADYKAGKHKVLVISSAGKEGIDLPDTTMVAIADPHFNPEVVEQAKARGIRIGGQKHRLEQDREVRVKRYISTLPPSVLNKLRLTKKRKSVEEWVSAVSERKAKSNKELKQLLKQLGGDKPIAIRPVHAPPPVAPAKVRGIGRDGVTFKEKRLTRKQRSDKGKKRGPYRKRVAGWKAETPDRVVAKEIKPPKAPDVGVKNPQKKAV